MKNNRKAKKIATWIIVPLMASFFVLDIITVALCNRYCREYPVMPEAFTYESGDDRIHFLNTANSDAILLESNGRFALIDSGEGNSNPRRKTEYQGFEETVVSYLLETAGHDNGRAEFDFILGTHCHYDHIGAFHAIITNENIIIDKAYFKGYDATVAKGYETEAWLLGETYNQIMDDLEARGVQIIHDLPKAAFSFGDFTVQFLNTDNSADHAGRGENAESVGVKITKGGKSAFLAADITKSTGLEEKLREEIGTVDLLKIGHHGYFGSSSMSFLRAIKPKLAIVTNQLGKIYPNVKWNLTMVAKCPIYATYDNDGIIVTFADSGELLLTNQIHAAAKNRTA